MKTLVFIAVFLSAIIGFSQQKDSLAFESNKTYTQQEIDSIIEKHRLGKLYIPLEDIGKILKSTKNSLGWTYYYYGMGSVTFRTQKYDSTVYYTDLGIDIYENQIKKRDFDERFLLNLHLVRSTALTELKRYEEAITSAQMALEYNKKYPYKWHSFIKTRIADNHFTIGNDSIALNYFLQAIENKDFASLPRPIVTTLTRIGNIYVNLDSIAKGREYLQKALEKSNTTSYKDNISSIHLDLAFLYHDERNYNKALFHIKKAIEANDEYGIGIFQGAEFSDRFIRSYVQVFEGNTYEGIKELNSVVDELSEIEKLTENDKSLMYYCLHTLTLGYQKVKNTAAYSNLMETSFNFMDKFYELKMKENLEDLEIKYETKEKDLSITQLEQSNAQQDTIIQQQQIITFSLIGFLILLSGLGFVIWRQSKLKTQYEKENLEQRLLRLQMNPHFIGNAMNTINALVEKKSKDTQKYVNNLSKLFRLILINSREEFVSLEDEIATLHSFLLLESNFSKKFNFAFTVSKDIDPEATVIPPMLIQPLIENAITHGFTNEKDGFINIEINKSNKHNMLICKITDNGKGYSESDGPSQGKQTSISGNIIRERIKTLKSKFKLDLKLTIEKLDDNVGTEAKLYLPYLVD